MSNSKIFGFFKLFDLVILGVLLIFSSIVILGSIDSNNATIQWNELREKSRNHSVMVDSYRECRTDWIDKFTCRMYMVMEGGLNGISQHKIIEIHDEIILTSNKIKDESSL